MKLECYYGGGDLLAAIDDLRARIVAGEIESIVITACTADRRCGWHWAKRDDMKFPWARMVAAHAAAGEELLREGT